MARRRGNGEGSIRHNVERQRWEARLVLDDGKRKMVTAPTRREVVRRLAETIRAHEHGEHPAAKNTTVATFLEGWLRDTLHATVAATTEQQYGDVVRLYIVPHVGRKRLRSLAPGDVSKMVRDLAAAGRSPNTQRLARTILRRALRWAEHEGLVTRNAAAISYGPRVPQPEGRTLTPDEARAFLASVAGHPLEAAWVVMLATGLRRGELLALTWSDVKLDGAPALTVRRSLKRLRGVGLVADEPKTSGSRRTLRLPLIAATALRDHRHRQREDQRHAGELWEPEPLGLDLIYRTPAGTAVDPDNFRQTTYAVTTAAGLGRWSPHEMRHSAASLLIAQGVPLKTISETLGHASIRITADVYGHLLADARSQAADAMDQALGG